jgi:hypothetical protein
MLRVAVEVREHCNDKCELMLLSYRLRGTLRLRDFCGYERGSR